MIENTRPESNGHVYAALLDAAHEPVFALDANGKILYANAAAARFFKRERRHLVGKPFTTLLSLDSRRAVRTALGKATTAPLSLEITLEGGDATTSLALQLLAGLNPTTLAATLGAESADSARSTTTPKPDVAAALDRFFLRFPYAVIGLSDELRVLFVNEQARQLLRTSSLRVGKAFPAGPLSDFAERVVALQALGQTTRIEPGDGRILRATGIGPRGAEPAVLIVDDVTLEERQDQVMREFVRNAAHQLRTPLTGIATAVEVLQAGAKNDPVDRDRFLDHVETHSRRLIRIARGLLVLARAQSGEHVRLEFVELRPLFEEVVAQAQPQDGVEISIDCDSTLAVLAERDLAHEVLAALVENAVQHTRQGSIRLNAYEQDGSVIIAVADTGGVGVLPEHRERIFEPFYRPQASGEGFGLGLAIAAQATAAMHGELGVEDADDGARFTIRLTAGRILE